MTMHPTRRQSEVLKAVMLRGSCGIRELAVEFAVSDETIRRDVKSLVAEGLVVKVHGAVLVPERLREPPFQRRMHAMREEKQRIALAAARTIRDGQSLMVDTGSTTCYVAQALREHSNLTLVTNSAEIARTLATRNGNRVYMAGGELRGDDGAALGSSAVAFVRQFQVQTAILSIGGIDHREGLMDAHLEEAEFSRTVIAQAERTLVVADHTKFGRKGFVKVCEWEAIDELVTDRVVPAPFANQLARAGVAVQTA